MRESTVLGEVLEDIQTGKSVQTSEILARPNELGVLKVSAVSWSTFRDDQAKALVCDYTPDESHKVRRGDFLISRANTKELVGAVVLVERDYPFRLLSDKTLRLLVDEDRILKQYLLFALRSAQARAHIENFASGSSESMRNISQDVITTIPLWLPPLSDQHRIAARLKAQMAEAETARQAALMQRKESDALLASIYREAFRRVVPVAVPPVFDEAPSGWQWRKLGDLARLESGHTPSRSRSDWWGGDVSWISLTEIRALDGQWAESTELRTNAAGITNSAARILPRGTVCFSRTASVGFVTIMAAPMATSQDFANWVCSDDLDPEFLMLALIRSRKDLREIATGATHKTIYMPQLQSFHLCAPDITEQHRIVARLKSQLAEADAIAQAAAAQLKEIEGLPQKLLAQAFSER